VKKAIGSAILSLQLFEEKLKNIGYSGQYVDIPDEVAPTIEGMYDQCICYLITLVLGREEYNLKVVFDIERESHQVYFGLKNLLEPFFRGKRKTNADFLAYIACERAHLNTLNDLLDVLQQGSYHKTLAKKTLRQRLFGCWPKKVGSGVSQFKESCKEE
jgi:hypothetical protein